MRHIGFERVVRVAKENRRSRSMLRTGGWVFHSSRSPLKFETVVRRVQRGWGKWFFKASPEI